MKHLLTLAALLVSTLSLAQFTPYNPDADNDQFLGAQDLLAFLPLFGENWNLDSLIFYSLEDLTAPEFCSLEANSFLCDVYYDFRQVPEDADIIHVGDTFGQYIHFILPSVPKTIIFLGTSLNNEIGLGFDGNLGQILDLEDPNGDESEQWFVQFAGPGYGASIVLGLGDGYYRVQ